MLVIWVVREVFATPAIVAVCDTDEEARGVLERLAHERPAFVSVEIRESVEHGGA